MVDLETSGFSPVDDDVIEVAVVQVQDDAIGEAWSSLVRPSQPIPASTTKIHGITNDMLMLAPAKKVITKRLRERLDGCLLVEHNQNGFDSQFLRVFLGEAIWVGTLNTLSLARAVIPDCGKFDLVTVCKCASISVEKHHTAETDALATAELLLYLQKRMRNSGISEAEIIELLGA